jgi:hypothetical protein
VVSGSASVSAVFFFLCTFSRLCSGGIVFRASSVPDGRSCQVLIVSMLCAPVLSHFNLLLSVF